jgi:hypothetical protein
VKKQGLYIKKYRSNQELVENVLREKPALLNPTTREESIKLIMEDVSQAIFGILESTGYNNREVVKVRS